MIRAVAFDVGETLIRDDRAWSARAGWLGVNRHTLSALVGAVVAQGRDNADALRLVRPGIDIEAERAAMERAGRGSSWMSRTCTPMSVRRWRRFGRPGCAWLLPATRQQAGELLRARPAGGLPGHVR